MGNHMHESKGSIASMEQHNQKQIVKPGRELMPITSAVPEKGRPECQVKIILRYTSEIKARWVYRRPSLEK